jgi:peptide deformylase
MAVKEVIRMGHPVLRKVAETVKPEEIQTKEFKQLLQDMLDTMKEQKGIGIAAPQIAVSKQVALIEILSQSERYPEAEESELLVIINPVLTTLDETTQGFWEGCLSVPFLRGFVERPRKIKVDFLDINGNAQSLEIEGFLATVFQHELDHLFGKLYVDRITDTTKLAYQEEYIQFHENNDVTE